MANHCESGFCPAGESIIVQKERAQSVRPREDKTLQPLHGVDVASDGEETEEAKVNESVVPEEGWKQISDKVEELAEKVAIHFEDENQNESRKPPIIRAPPQPTKEELERHQTTHTPYAAWCKHCVAARVVRRQHPHRGRGAIIVPDVDGDIQGPIKVSLDYMYLHDRMGKYREVVHNPPQLVMNRT